MEKLVAVSVLADPLLPSFSFIDDVLASRVELSLCLSQEWAGLITGHVVLRLYDEVAEDRFLKLKEALARGAARAWKISQRLALLSE